MAATLPRFRHCPDVYLREKLVMRSPRTSAKRPLFTLKTASPLETQFLPKQEENTSNS